MFAKSVVAFYSLGILCGILVNIQKMKHVKGGRKKNFSEEI